MRGLDAFGAETIDRFLHTSYDAFAGRATIPMVITTSAARGISSVHGVGKRHPGPGP